jgi:hypothetical protein
MAHWHDFNPWSKELIYLPSLEEAAECCLVGGETLQEANGQVVPYTAERLIDHWLHTSQIYGTPGKLDAYLLRDGPLSRGPREMHCGVRWGAQPEQYFSPWVKNQARALELFRKYGGGGA